MINVKWKNLVATVVSNSSLQRFFAFRPNSVNVTIERGERVQKNDQFLADCQRTSLFGPFSFSLSGFQKTRYGRKQSRNNLVIVSVTVFAFRRVLLLVRNVVKNIKIYIVGHRVSKYLFSCPGCN